MNRVKFLRREISRNRSIWHQIAIVVASVAAAALLRLMTDQGSLGVPFLSYAPVVLLASIFFRWRMGSLAAALSLISIMVFFELVPAGSTGGRPLVVIAAIAITATALVYIGDTLHVAVGALEEQRKSYMDFNAELQHRNGNALQIIQAFVAQAARAPDPRSSYRDLLGRISAMGTANRLLGPDQMQSCDLRELISNAIRPFPQNRFKLLGPTCRISGNSGVRLVMALHELSTNAIKFGALSMEQGSVTLDWQVRDKAIEIHWKEEGGPPVQPPTRKGIGSSVLSPSPGLNEVELIFNVEGLECRLVAIEDPGEAVNREPLMTVSRLTAISLA